jgi:CRP-like cAMP-binding protein
VLRHAARLRGGRWFAGLDEDFQRALLRAAHERTLASGERLFSRGDPPDGMFAVVDGALRVTAVTEAGREVVLTRAEPPAWLGEIAVFDRQPRTHDCIADGAAVVLHLPLAALDALLQQAPHRWRDLGVLVAGKLRLAFHVMEDAAALPVAVRLARRLVLMSGGLGDQLDHARRLVTVSQEQLASMLGSRPRKARKLSMAGRLPPTSRISRLRRDPVSASKMPDSSNALQASALSTSAHL